MGRGGPGGARWLQQREEENRSALLTCVVFMCGAHPLWWRLPVQRRMLRSILSLYPLDASSIPLVAATRTVSRLR